MNLEFNEMCAETVFSDLEVLTSWKEYDLGGMLILYNQTIRIV